MMAISSTASAGPITASAVTATPPRRWRTPCFWCRAIPRSTNISATLIGAWAGSSTLISNGAMRWPSGPTRTKSRSCKRNSKAAWNPVAIRPEQLRVAAPAKINLNLHVTRKRPDSYHDLQSLVAFADVGDVLMLERSAELSLAIEGPFAAGLAGDADNLILKAARALAPRLS